MFLYRILKCFTPPNIWQIPSFKFRTFSDSAIFQTLQQPARKSKQGGEQGIVLHTYFFVRIKFIRNSVLILDQQVSNMSRPIFWVKEIQLKTLWQFLCPKHKQMQDRFKRKLFIVHRIYLVDKNYFLSSFVTKFSLQKIFYYLLLL